MLLVIFLGGAGTFPALISDMKQNSLTLTALAVAVAAGAVLLVPRESSGQAGADDPLLSPLIADLAKQQLVVTENQRKIEEKLALISEDIRVARIFVGRGGGKVGAP